jgi:hypothetical protein
MVRERGIDAPLERALAANKTGAKFVGLPVRFAGRTAGECHFSRNDEFSDRSGHAIKRLS